MNILSNGPYISALGWLGAPDYTSCVAASKAWSQLERTLMLNEGHVPIPTPQAPHVEQDALAPLPSSFLKASGVARARSASRSTVFAATLAKALVGTIRSESNVPGDRIGVGIVASSAVMPIFWQFESVGLSESWDMTDTTLLPASIPTSVPTAVSSVTDCHAAAVTFHDGIPGMFAAFEHALLSFHHGRADYYLVMSADEASEPLLRTLRALNLRRAVLNGAAGIVLSRQPQSSHDWQVTSIERVPAHHQAQIPQDWPADAERLRIRVEDPYPMFTGPMVVQSIHRAVETNSTHALLEFTVNDRERCVLGLRRSGLAMRQAA